ncbi:MAG: MBL fold metallo-hydrolase [Nanoarchaeota archaeon]
MENFSYIIADPQTKEAAVVDPGFEHEKILNKAKEQNLKITKILLTHAHFDHTTDLPALEKATKAEIYIHEKEPFDLKLKTKKVKDGDIIPLGSLKIEVIHTPGHTQGGVCFLIGKKLITGDTLFVNSMGRTDLGGNEKEMFESLKKLSELPDNTEVYPGHDYGGKKSTIKQEKENNPFMKF